MRIGVEKKENLERFSVEGNEKIGLSDFYHDFPPEKVSKPSRLSSTLFPNTAYLSLQETYDRWNHNHQWYYSRILLVFVKKNSWFGSDEERGRNICSC